MKKQTKEMTPMMKLLQAADNHEAMIKRLGENNYNLGALSAVAHFKEWINELRPEEIKAIEDAWDAAKDTGFNGQPYYARFDNYFTDKYGQ